MNAPIPSWRDAYGRRRPGGDHIYVVTWPDGVTKAGWTWYESRWRAFIGRGARLVALMSSEHYDISTLESRVLGLLADLGAPAFEFKADAADYLGTGGAGYLECYRLSTARLAQLEDALAAIPTKAGE